MEQDSEQAYYARREQQARALAARSRDEAIRRIHLQLADHYAGRQRESRPTLKLVIR